MKPLIVYYSRTGTTKKIAELLSSRLKSDIEEIIDTKNRKGLLGYVLAGKDASLKKLTVIEKPKKNPNSYHLVIIGTPIWAGRISTPVMTYLANNKGKIKQLALFTTKGGSDCKNLIKEVEEVSGKTPSAFLELTTKEVLSGNCTAKVDGFVAEIKKS